MNKSNEKEEKEKEEELNFDFNFDDLESDNDSIENEEIVRPYQWGTNIQFVNISTSLNLKRKASNKHHFQQLHLCQSIFSEKESNIEYDEEKKICYTDDEDDGLTENIINNPDQHRKISTFYPKLYDICSLQSFPLNILNINNDSLSLPYDCLEYLHCNLPDFTEFNNYLSLILNECGYQLRIANFIATINNFSSMITNGGSKILHFIAYICNPIRDCDQYPLLTSTFPKHCNNSYYKCDVDYILIQQEEMNGFTSGKWMKVTDLLELICFTRHNKLNDIIIAISPQSNKLCDIFSNLFGYKYVIGVEYNDGNNKSFSCSQTAIFLKYFYSSILNQECVDRAFKLAKTSTLLHANNRNRNINIILRTRNENNSARYVIFPHLKVQCATLTHYNHLKNVENIKNINYNLIKTRPFIGRRKNMIDLISAINKCKISLVIGEENNGKSCLIQNTVRYLFQNCYFNSCFLIDCDKNHTNINHTFMELLCEEIEIEIDMNNMNNLFNNVNMNICLIILNINKWKKENEIYEFLDRFSVQSNDKCKCILSTNKMNKKLNKNNKNNIVVLHLKQLNRKYISQIFVLLMSKNEYNIEDIMNHDALHEIFNGSARITKCVAEFVNSINSKYNHQLSLNEIAIKYPQSQFAKHYKSQLTVCIPSFPSFPCVQRVQYENKIAIDFENFHYDLVNEYDSFPDINIKNQSMDFDGLSLFTTKAPSQSYYEHDNNNTLKLSPKDSDEPILDMNFAKINGYNSGSGSGSSDDTPSPIMMYNYQRIYNYNYEYEYDNVSEEDLTHDKSVVVLFGKHSSNMSFSNQHLNDMTDSLSLKLLNQDSQVEVEEDEDENDGLGNVINLNVIAHLSRIKDTDARAIWIQAGSNDYNQYGYLYKLYPFLMKKFQFMTRTKHNSPCLLELEYYFLLFGGKYVRNTNVSVIHVTKYDKFYGWFVFMCLVVGDLRMIYDNYDLNCLFYDKQTCNQILKIKELGIFMLSFTNRINYLAIKYRKKNKSNDICTMLLKRHNKDLYSINGSNEKVSLFQIIRPRTYLKYLYTKDALIAKKKVF